jgi:hypothetical protein
MTRSANAQAAAGWIAAGLLILCILIIFGAGVLTGVVLS